MDRLPFRAMGALARTAVPVLAALVLLAGCGSDGVPAKTWATHVCQALKPWTSTVSKLTRQTQREMQQVTTPDAAKVTLLNLLDSEAKATDKARDRLLAAGVPDVDDGKKIADEFTAALTSARDSYRTARDAIRKLPTTNAKSFYDGVSSAIDKLNSQYDAGALDTSKVRSEPLQQAFDEVPECQ